MAAQRPMDVTLVSATDLKNVNFFSRMDVYAVAWLSTAPRARQRGATARGGGRNPSWNGAPALRFFVPEGLDPALLTLYVCLRSERFLGDRDVGEVRIPIKELEPAGASADSAPRFVSYEVRRPSGRAKGVLNLSVRFGESVAARVWPAYPVLSKAEEPVTAYPAAPSVAYPPPGAYPPAGYAAYHPHPAHTYGYGAPPPPGYGYPPAPGFGYPPAPGFGYGAAPVVVQQQAPGRSNFGMGMGAGLLGGALGGLVLGDMLSDDAAAYDAGYDAGFDDGGAFGF